MVSLALSLQPKSMQQIAALIITFAAYVAGIRNSGSGPNDGAIADYESYSTPYNEDFFPSQSLAHHAAMRQSNDFRPSQMLEFTPADASVLKRYPPSYQQSDYHTKQIAPSGPTLRHEVTTPQFAFPSQREQATSSSAIATNSANIYNNNNNAFVYNHESPQRPQQQLAVPPQLQSTPILTYRDPYTNELNNHQLPYRQTQHYQQPQEYTVQSMLVVGADQASPPSSSSPHRYSEHKRPGYVFDEQLSASYARPTYAADKYSTAAAPLSFEHQRQQQKQPARPTNAQLSYDSHDYPPPSYHQQQTSNFQSPQRHDTANYAQTPAATTTTTIANSPYAMSNYANKFGNYLQGEKQQQQHQQQLYQGNYKPSPHYNNDVQYVARPPQPPPSAAYYQPGNRPIRPGPPPPLHSNNNNNNYYEYQMGEIPPPPGSSYRPGPPPPYRPLPPTQSVAGGGGLASLASLFSSTQEYAPQFTNLLLSGIGAGGGGGGGRPGKRPLNMQLIKALENIARNDDLQCVPKVLCTMIAGQTQRGQLPSFVTSPAITNFLAGFPASSPALIYGRAALLGISGGERSCTQTYAKCPKNEYEILYYLNNHRGGFFKFFSEPEEQATPTKQQQQQQQEKPQADNDSTSLFSILSALTGNAPQSNTTPRPKPPPTVASFDITNGIGNFFTNVLSEYLGGVEYQRRRRRRRRRSAVEQEMANKVRELTESEDFHDEEDDEDTQSALDFVDDEESNDSDSNNVQLGDVDGRVLHKQVTALKFFPADNDNERATDNSDKNLRTVIEHFNRAETQRKLKFPSANEEREYETDSATAHTRRGKGVQFKDESEVLPTPNRVNFVDDNAKETRRGKAVVFKEPNDANADPQTRFEAAANDVNGHVFFPDHYEKHIRKGRIVNRPEAAYADTYADYVRSRDDERDRFVLANNKRRPAATNDYNGGVKIHNNHNYNAIYSSQSASVAQHNYNSHTNIYSGSGGGSNRYHNRPPYASDDAGGGGANTNYKYPNSNYVSNNRYGNRYQSQQRSTRAPTPRHEDDHNIYVNNSQGVTTYYVTPDGRKIYL